MAVVIRLEANDIVRQESPADLPAHPRGQEHPVVLVRPWDVNELLDERVRQPLADQRRRQVEVIILQEDDRLLAPPQGRRPVDRVGES